ncbi:glycosyltransferase family 2 protein [Alloacidobacterium dinghuense]|uniref:Glycosyltransferase family 2 protein n=1 Tax=Alloacidobacterium dinghuense TaxID=2763107 RepID=A0A7G8BJH3_9BACT|nr:glycosyltransferase family A protein [Alloacidobacterium dinghuense]QNI32693.1 glycosyltransferase family 2 protein [Alloacidobacterium dinghuense]
MQHSITVGLPVYNAMPFLPEAMESILQQTASNFSILVVVDGATDGSLEYLEAIRDNRLRILSQAHAGLPATLNRLLREAKTGWLVRQDADDVSYPKRIERIQEHISREPDAGMFYSLAEYYPSSHSMGLFRSSRGSPQELRQIVQSGYLLSICHPTVALNVEKTLAVGGYRNLAHAEDADLWWRMALQYDIHLLPEILLGFRQNASSISSRYSYIQELHGLYIQYLLLSHLSDQKALPFADLVSLLETRISARRLEAKRQLRCLNMNLGAKHYGGAFMALVLSFLASPAYFAQRVKDELFPNTCVANGVSPEFFYRRKEVFWP